MTSLSNKQLTSVREAKQRVNIWDGSIRSGKTVASMVSWILFCNSSRGSAGELVMIGRTRDAVWRNVIGPLMDPSLMGIVAEAVEGNYGAPTVRVLGERVFVMGANDIKAEAVLRGLTVKGVYVDEITVLPENFFAQLLGRMSPRGARLFGTTNPDNPHHWLKVKYLDRNLPNWARWHFLIEDNPYLDPDYVRSIRREFTGLWYKRFIQGLWVVAEGSIFEHWDEDKFRVAWEDLPEMSYWLPLGVDYGTTNPTAAILAGYGTDERYYLVDEWRYEKKLEGKAATDSELSLGLRTWLFEEQHHPYQEVVLPPPVVDPAAASFRIQLSNDGLPTNPANNEVLTGIRRISSLIGGDKLRVSDRCKGFLLEAPGYTWDSQATLKGRDEPIKRDDHSLDAGRYAIMADWKSSEILTGAEILVPGGSSYLTQGY